MTDDMNLEEKYTRMVKDDDGLSASIDKHLVNVDREVSDIEELVQRIGLKSKSNKQITPAEINVLTLYVRQAILGHKATQHVLQFLVAQMTILTLLAQKKTEMKIEVPKNIEKQLILWTERMENAAKAQSEYVK